VLAGDVEKLAEGVAAYHEVQLAEGMQPLPEFPGTLAQKYCGGGHGGYALYLFATGADRDRVLAQQSSMRAVEPYCHV
jgi:hypothetical protein